jgi:hypothetical protein
MKRDERNETESETDKPNMATHPLSTIALVGARIVLLVHVSFRFEIKK